MSTAYHWDDRSDLVTVRPGLVILVPRESRWAPGLYPELRAHYERAFAATMTHGQPLGALLVWASRSAGRYQSILGDAVYDRRLVRRALEWPIDHGARWTQIVALASAPAVGLSGQATRATRATVFRLGEWSAILMPVLRPAGHDPLFHEVTS